MGVLRYIGYLPQLVGLIMVVVDMVESLKGGSLGPEKKKAVLDSLGSSWGAIQKEFKVDVPFAAFSGIIGVLIDLVVAVLNTVGYFTHAATGKEA